MAIRFVNSRRVAANRVNAQKSTGPRTPAGKAKSSLNAVKTGLTGRTILLSHEDVGEYKAHVERFWDELQPVGELEENMVQSLADTQWRLNRIPGLESAILAIGRKKCAKLFPEEKNKAVRALLIEGQVQSTEAQPLKNLYMQESRLRRRYEKDMQELRTLQAERERERSRQTIQRQLDAKRAAQQQEEEENWECTCGHCHEQPEGEETEGDINPDGFEFANPHSKEEQG